MSHSIYFIYCTNIGELLYVGRSSEPERRFKDHKRRFGENIRLHVHQVIEDLDEAMRAEIRAIADYWPIHNRGFVSTRGMIGKKHSAETRAQISASKMGHTVSAEVREKLRRANLGATHTLEAREKIAEASRARPRTPETAEKISRALKGKPLSDAHRAKLRAAWERRRAQ